MTAPEFVADMLWRIRRTFFAKSTDKQFYQEKPRLTEAITYPARWLNERGARLPAAQYRRILQTIIDTIRRRGNRDRVRRFSVYFLHCVQEHMGHHGEEYYYAAKDPRPVGSILSKTLGRIQGAERSDRTVEVLSEVHRTLRTRRPPGARIQKTKNGDSELPFLSSCKPTANPSEPLQNTLKPLRNRPD